MVAKHSHDYIAPDKLPLRDPETTPVSRETDSLDDSQASSQTTPQNGALQSPDHPGQGTTTGVSRQGVSHATQAVKSNNSDRWYLENVRADSFGAYANKLVGPFSSKMTVVFGRNEAGKSTTRAFIDGVLFGWPEARGSRNTYKPEYAERAGALFFRNIKTGKEAELSRVRNADGLKGNTSIVSDIDKETYRTMFSLDAEELLGLKNTTDMTARLLTAGSGTDRSPAHARANLEAKAADLVSRKASQEHSILNLKSRMDAVREEAARARKQAAEVREEDLEFHELIPRIQQISERISSCNEQVSRLTTEQALYEKAATRYTECSDEKAERVHELMQVRAEEKGRAQAHVSLPDVPDVRIPVLRDKLIDLENERYTLEHRIAQA